MGFVKQLLARAEGTLPSPLPTSRPYFAGDAGPADPPLSEIMREVQAPEQPTNPNDEQLSSEARSAPFQSDAAPDPIEVKSRPEQRGIRSDSYRLAAKIEPTSIEQVQTGPVRVATGSDGDRAANRIPSFPLDHIEGEHSDSRSPDAQNQDRQPTHTDPEEPSNPALQAPDLQAAIAQLLGGPSATQTNEPTGGNQSSFVATQPTGAAQQEEATARRPDVDAENNSEPITIHIGEIVVAPVAPPPVSTTERKAWSPPVSINDYRAKRAQEWQ